MRVEGEPNAICSPPCPAGFSGLTLLTLFCPAGLFIFTMKSKTKKQIKKFLFGKGMDKIYYLSILIAAFFGISITFSIFGIVGIYNVEFMSGIYWIQFFMAWCFGMILISKVEKILREIKKQK